MALVDGHLVAAITEVEADVGVMEKVVGKPLLDILLLVACTNDKLVVAEIGIFLHDVPENGHTTNLDHGFGFIGGLLGDTGAETAG
jgi:hypothetical protein